MVQSFFPGLAANPDLVGFIWFNYAVSQNGMTNDWRLNSTADVFDAFSTGLAASTYGRERGKRAVLVPRDGQRGTHDDLHHDAGPEQQHDDHVDDLDHVHDHHTTTTTTRPTPSTTTPTGAPSASVASPERQAR